MLTAHGADRAVRYGVASVLVVDDDEDLREALVDLIENGGYTAVGLANGQEAIDYLANEASRPKLMLLDLMMPVMDGWEVLKEMRQDAALVTIPVVVISARYAELAHESEATPQVRRMAKPLDVEALFQIIAQTCGHAPR